MKISLRNDGLISIMVVLVACGLAEQGSPTPTASPVAAGTATVSTQASATPLPTSMTEAVVNPTSSPGPIATDIPAFPGAEGFGAGATGGRGGQVIYVTTLDADANGEVKGSLNWALRQTGPRIIVFKVSGVIDGPAYIRAGDVTLAGQTSPGGIIMRGLLCDDHYEHNDCRNIIIRHIRSRPAPASSGRTLFALLRGQAGVRGLGRSRRPAAQLGNPDGVLDDALRLDGVATAIIDHGSFANATDEAIQLSWSKDITIQNSLLAETVGEHFDRGGMLINYSHSSHPQDNLSILRNMWHRIGGRMPELSCELNGYPDQDPERPSFCAAQPLNIEIANNLLWDPGLPMWYNPLVDPGGDASLGLFLVNLNYVNNYVVGRAGYGQPMVLDSFIQQAGNSLYLSGNQMNLYSSYRDYQLVYCCNDFNTTAPNTELGVATRRESRHDFPSITYLPTDQVLQYMIGNVGAFPRDPMDRRFIKSLQTNTIDPTPLDRPGAADALTLNFNSPPPAPTDSDQDGMPDVWETANGLNPQADDHNGTVLSVKFTGVDGYTNLECYLNALSDQIVTGTGAP